MTKREKAIKIASDAFSLAVKYPHGPDVVAELEIKHRQLFRAVGFVRRGKWLCPLPHGGMAQWKTRWFAVWCWARTGGQCGIG